MSLTLQEIFKSGMEGYIKTHKLGIDQWRAAQAIMDCGTEVMGEEVWRCLEDDYTESAYHSCRHRSCPRCYRAYTQAWLERVQDKLLNCPHFHVVFTLPHELNDLWRYNRAWSADHLMRAASECVRELLADPKYLGAQVGIIAAVHTWGRTLNFHPHVHLLVTGGGLHNGQWHSAQADYLLPVAVLKAKFRGKWLTWLNQAEASGAIALPAGCTAAQWRRTLRTVAKKRWNVRIEAGGIEGRDGVCGYLARYLRGGPIKNSRLLHADDTQVCFAYRDLKDGKDKTMNLRREQFLNRVLSHVPVKGKHQIRGYGLYSSRGGAHCAVAAGQLPKSRQASPAKREEKSARHCPRCGSTLMHSHSRRRAFSLIRSPMAPGEGGIVQQGAESDRHPSRSPPRRQGTALAAFSYAQVAAL